ncbi:MAG: GNAT family N-acetyltransferase [Actinobacteria bacterium]|jgi:GNAT superfamily N-acetyltransferase|nr:GNAT family N-acetyltransferase [Actinomycetota bacterium]
MVAVGDGSSDVLVREATPGDAPAVAGLLDALGYPDGVEAVRDRLTIFAAYERDEVLVAELDGAVVAFLALNVTPTFAEAGWVSRITAFVVAPDVRRAGVGMALMDEAERRATEAGSRLMQINSGRRPERAAAHHFYTSLGYRDQHDHHVLYDKRLNARGEG